MKETQISTDTNTTKKVKTFGYILGQLLATVVVLCLVALIIGITYAILCRII